MIIVGIEVTNNTDVRNQCREQEVGYLKIGSDAGRECSPFYSAERVVVGVRKRSSRGKGLYIEDVHRHGEIRF
jgi:hypothetical protein